MRKVRGFTAISLLVISLAGTTAFAAGSGTKSVRGGSVIGQAIKWVSARFLSSPRSQSRITPPIPAPPPPQPEGTESRLEPPIPIPTTT